LPRLSQLQGLVKSPHQPLSFANWSVCARFLGCTNMLSVSGDKEHRPQVFEMADWLVAQMKKLNIAYVVRSLHLANI